MLGRMNSYVHVFSRVVDRLAVDASRDLYIILTASRNRGDEKDPYRYNIFTAHEGAMIIPEEVGQVGERDIIVPHYDNGQLKRMYTLATAYDSLQYPPLYA